ncbi:hypothetical protein OAT67_00035 [Bacteriovoracaceae bacterium]|nr:hypothetical protein [Bacteriovoracaceae bacterium]|tara:strand:+ start:297595 stop:297783 length:189 start_codon:yes stop_codon:yes gene_type:complete
MKNLFFLIIAILVMNVSFAGNMGEEQAAECVDQVQSTRFQETAEQAPAVATEESQEDSAKNK